MISIFRFIFKKSHEFLIITVVQTVVKFPLNLYVLLLILNHSTAQQQLIESLFFFQVTRNITLLTFLLKLNRSLGSDLNYPLKSLFISKVFFAYSSFKFTMIFFLHEEKLLMCKSSDPMGCQTTNLEHQTQNFFM